MANFGGFNARSSADEIAAGKRLDGKNVLITGANIGIGYETAKVLAGIGARVILAGRNEAKNRQAISEIQAAHPRAEVEFVRLDLASLTSVRECAESLPVDTLDMLIANAGLMCTDYQETEDGFEKTVGVCHIGHASLIKQLMPQLLAADKPRVIMLSSTAHQSPARLDFDNFPYSPKTYGVMKAYGQAKLCNLLYAKELQRRYGDQGLTACAVHPGNMVTTNFGNESKLVSLAMKLVSPFTKNANQGAATTVLCALHEPVEDIAGEYFSHCQPARTTREAQNPETAARVWDITEQWLERKSAEIAA